MLCYNNVNFKLKGDYNIMDNKEINYSGVIQRLLYDYPLYNYINKDNVNILVIGFSKLSEQFVDMAFEVAQVNSYKLNITVVSDNPNVKDEYLKNRPSFTKFFSVDNNTVDDDYGRLSFEAFDSTLTEDNISNLLLDDENKKYAYLFISSDNEKTDLRIAKFCSDCKSLLEDDYVVNCVLKNKRKANKNINIVPTEETIFNHKDYSKLKKMAFNCHFVWSNSLLIDIRKLQREFNSKYYFNSSFNNILSIKYKLNSIGLDFNSKNVAEQFYSIVHSKNYTDKMKVNGLICAEHKRWNVSMICDGYTAPNSLYKYVIGEQSKRKGYHPCLVRSKNNVSLTYDWKKNNYQLWDVASKQDLDALDELDRLSVNLHREYKKRADEIRKKNLIPQNDIFEIDKLLEKYPDARKAFKSYVLCLQEINSGNSKQTKLYQYNKANLNSAIVKLPKGISKIIKKRLSTIEESFAPIIESEKYIDYKQYDKDLVNNIPFILSYKTTYHLGIPFGSEQNVRKNQVLFSNIAAVLAINPSRVTFFFEYSNSELSSLINAINYCTKCLDNHNVRSVINMCLISEKKLSEEELNKITSVSSRTNNVDVICFDDEDDLETKLNEYIKNYRFFALEKNQTNTSRLMYGMRCYRNNPYYEYDSKNGLFSCFNGCNELSFIPFDISLRISDLFKVNEVQDNYNLPDLQRDYQYFWNKYKRKTDDSTKSENVWKALCACLSLLDEKNIIKISDVFDNEMIENEFFIEASYMNSLSKIMNELIRINSSISFSKRFRSNNVFSVKINAPTSVAKVIKSIISNPQKLVESNNISVSKIGFKDVKIYFNSLIVPYKGILDEKKISEYYVSKDDVNDLLDEIIKDNYILLNNNSLCFSSHQVKSLLTQEGRVLELYVYYKLLNAGFDEVATSVEVIRDANTENEFDLILTKKNKSVLIECKAQSKLKQTFYDKLYRLNEQYGINSIALIIADCNPNNDENMRLIEFGERLGIKTVCGNNRINNIDKVLREIIKES